MLGEIVHRRKFFDDCRDVVANGMLNKVAVCVDEEDGSLWWQTPPKEFGLS